MKILIRSLFASIFCLFSCLIFAQEIDIIPSTGVDVSPYISDWENYQGQFFVDFIREEDFPRQVFLQVELIHNGTRSLIKANSAPFEIPAGLWELRVDNPEVFDWPDVVVNSDYQNVNRAARLGEGLYEICIRVFDAPTNQPISEACTDFEIVLPQAPQIIFPDNGETIEPDNFVVEWTPVEGYDGQYIITLVEQYATQVGQEAIEANPPFHTDEVFGLTSYLFPINLLDFNPQANYCVRVQAIDEENRPASTNKGYSDVVCVNLASPNDNLNNINDIDPSNILAAQVLCPYPSSEIPANNVSINWEPLPEASAYDLYVYKTPKTALEGVINIAETPYYSQQGISSTEVSFSKKDAVFHPGEDYSVLITPSDFELPTGNINEVLISPSTYFKTQEEKEYEELQRIFAILEIVRKNLEKANENYSNNDLIKELRTYYIFSYLMYHLAQPIEAAEFSIALENIISGNLGGMRDYHFDDYRNALTYLEQLLEYLHTYGNFSDERKDELKEIQHAIGAALDTGITKENFKEVTKRISRLFKNIRINHNTVYLEITKYIGVKGMEILFEKFIISKIAGDETLSILNGLHHIKKMFMDVVNLLKFISLDKPALEKAEYEYYAILQALMKKALQIKENGEYMFRIPACSTQPFVIFTAPGNVKNIKKITIKLETYCLVDDGKGGKTLQPCETPIVEGGKPKDEIEIKGKDLEKHVFFDDNGCPITTYVYEFKGKVCCRKNCMIVAKITTEYKDGSKTKERLFMGVTTDPKTTLETKDDSNDDDDDDDTEPVNTPNPFNQQPTKVPLTEVPDSGNQGNGGKKDPCKEFDEKYDALTLEINNCKDDCEKIQKQIDELEDDKAKLVAKNNGNTDEIDALKKRIDDIQKDIDKKIAEMQKIIGDRGKVVEYEKHSDLNGDNVGEQGLGFEFGNGYRMKEAYDDYEKKTGKSIGEGVAEINDLRKQRDKLKKEKEKKEKDAQKEKGKHQKAIDDLDKKIKDLKKRLIDCKKKCKKKKEARDQFAATNPDCHKRKQRYEAAENALEEAGTGLNETGSAVANLKEASNDQKARAQGACDPKEAEGEDVQDAVEEIREIYRKAQDLYVESAKALHAGDFERAKALAEEAKRLIDGIKIEIPKAESLLGINNQHLWNQPRRECDNTTEQTYQRSRIQNIQQIIAMPNYVGNAPANQIEPILLNKTIRQFIESISTKANEANLIQTPLAVEWGVDPNQLKQNMFLTPQGNSVQLPLNQQINRLDIYVDYVFVNEIMKLTSVCDGCQSQLQTKINSDQNLQSENLLIGSIPWESPIKDAGNNDPLVAEYLAQELQKVFTAFIIEASVFK